MSTETFGDYEIRAKLGEGGMARVHRALWKPRNIEVALKRIHPDPDPQVIRRFHREIQIASRLSHEHIVPLLDHGQVEETPYYSMQLVEGGTLMTQIQERKSQGKALTTLPEFFGLARALCSALTYLHEHKVIHRDLKPSNVFITPQGKPLLADFGLSRMEALTKMTSTGSVMGTPLYMAPEQFDGVMATEAIDVYQMGLVFYEVLTGKLPFEELREVQAVVFHRTTRRIPPPSNLNPLVPPAVDRFVMRCLCAAPADRYASAAAMEAALRSAESGQLEAPVALRQPSRVTPRPAPPEQKPAPRWHVVAGAGLLLAAAGALPIVLWGRAPREPGAASAAETDGILEFALEPRSTEAVVTFRTGEPAVSTLLLESPDGEVRVPISSTPATRHATWVANLAPATEYGYRIVIDGGAAGKQATAPRRFRTVAE